MSERAAKQTDRVFSKERGRPTERVKERDAAETEGERNGWREERRVEGRPHSTRAERKKMSGFTFGFRLLVSGPCGHTWL